VNTQRYERTLYTRSCASTSVTWQLDRKYTSFRANVGLSDNSSSFDKVTFSVLVDGEKRAEYPLSVGALQSIPRVDLRDAFRVTLEAEPGNCDINGGKAVWINSVIS
jgi:hypothetical protein